MLLSCRAIQELRRWLQISMTSVFVTQISARMRIGCIILSQHLEWFLKPTVQQIPGNPKAKRVVIRGVGQAPTGASTLLSCRRLQVTRDEAYMRHVARLTDDDSFGKDSGNYSAVVRAVGMKSTASTIRIMARA
jgi:hypothetical protein